MLTSQDVTSPFSDPLDAIGAEPLAGSGFENEEPEQGFNFEPEGIGEEV